MPIRQIRLLGDPVLREPCRAVEDIDDEIQRLIDDLMDTMYDAEGIGLAAPQIGVSQRVFVYDVSEEGHPPGVLVNPRIVESAGTVRESEGCLSIPDLTEIVERSVSVVAEGLDREGRLVRLEAGGLLSRCFQHESDHLDGILFFDRISPLKRRMLLAKWAKRIREEGSG
ncbi:MAG: peptide deformylase [Gemmatimonadota bacterium]